MESLHVTFLLRPLIGSEALNNFLARMHMIIWGCAPKFREAQFKHLIHAILSLSLSPGVIQVDRYGERGTKEA